MALTAEQLEEEEFEFARLAAEAEAQEQSALEKAAETAEFAMAPTSSGEGRTALDDTIGAGLSGLRGATSGWSDEAFGGVRALTSYAEDLLQGENPWASDAQGLGGRYETFRDDLRGRQEDFSAANPKTALGLELAGALVSPMNKVAPGLGTTGSMTTRIGQSMARGGLEGAVAGLGEGEGSIEDQLVNTAKGAGLGAGFSGALTAGGGGLGKAISNRNVRPRLQQRDDTFKPLSMQEDAGVLKDVYRGFLGRVWGAKDDLAKQEKPFRDVAQAGVDAATDAQRALKRSLASETDEIADTVRMAAGETADVVERNARNFRAQAAQEAIPDDFRAEFMEGVDTEDVQNVAAKLKGWWNENGFKMVKDRQFNWDDTLADSVGREFADDPGLMVALADAPGLIKKLEDRFGMTEALQALKTGNPEKVPAVMEGLFSPKLKLDGDALMEMRNVFARAANKTADPVKGRAYGRIKQKFDDMIRDQLREQGGDVAVDQFNDQIRRWTTQRNYLDSAKKAREFQGKFTPKQWIASSGKYGDAATGSAPLQGQADTALIQAREAADRLKQVKAERPLQVREMDKLERGFEASDALAKAKKAQADLKGIPQGDTSGLSSLLTTSAAGAPLAAVLGGVSLGTLGAAVPAGIATGKALASRPAQNLLAGQTGWQRRLAQALREGDTAKYQRLLSRMAAQQGSQ